MKLPSYMTDCGLPGVDKVPYGLHACHFYKDADELLDALVPYFLAGLYNAERCLWVTAPPLTAAQAARALESAWPGSRKAMQKGALSIAHFGGWYDGARAGSGQAVIDAWLREEERAFADGYSGLRIAGNPSFLEPEDRAAFLRYEREVSVRFDGRRIVALCSYALEDCSAAEASAVVHAHNCAFHKADAGWHVLSRPQRTARG